MSGVVNFNQPSKGTVTSNEAALYIINNGWGNGITSEAKNSIGVSAISHGPNAAVKGVADKEVGIYGICNGEYAGVRGSSSGNGVHGSGTANGVYGESQGNGDGVVGETGGERDTAQLTNQPVPRGTGNGVKGISHHTGDGVHGMAKNGSGVFGKSENWLGVYGQSDKGHGVWGQTTNDGAGAGVVGKSKSWHGVHGENTGTGIGVFGKGTIAGRFEGDVEVTGDVKLVGADCAEDFDIASTENIEPGTVMVLNESGALLPSYQEYDKKVAGIISGAGGYKPAIILGKKQFHSSSGSRLPIALMGKAYCKVDARHSSIEIGDLLTTSPTKGHAMKAEDPSNAFGAVIGKSLGSIKQGMGMIPVLVALQ